MFNIGMMELILVLGVAFLVVGPKDLPKVARWLGRQVRNIRKLIREVKKETGWDEFAKEFKDTKDDIQQTFREADVSDELRQTAADIHDSVDSIRREAEKAADTLNDVENA